MIGIAFFIFLILFGLYGIYLLASRNKQMGFWMLVTSFIPFWIIFIGLGYKIIYQRPFEMNCYGEGSEERLRSFHIHSAIISVIWGFVCSCITTLILYIVFRLTNTWKKLEPISFHSLLAIFLLLVVFSLASGYLVYLTNCF